MKNKNTPLWLLKLKVAWKCLFASKGRYEKIAREVYRSPVIFVDDWNFNPLHKPLICHDSLKQEMSVEEIAHLKDLRGNKRWTDKQLDEIKTMEEEWIKSGRKIENLFPIKPK